MMSNGRSFDERAIYEIKVMGVLDQSWSDWFDGFSISRIGHETMLQGEVVDQAALLGLLTKIIGLGLTLIFVKRKNRRKNDAS